MKRLFIFLSCFVPHIYGAASSSTGKSLNIISQESTINRSAIPIGKKEYCAIKLAEYKKAKSSYEACKRNLKIDRFCNTIRTNQSRILLARASRARRDLIAATEAFLDSDTLPARPEIPSSSEENSNSIHISTQIASTSNSGISLNNAPQITSPNTTAISSETTCAGAEYRIARKALKEALKEYQAISALYKEIKATGRLSQNHTCYEKFRGNRPALLFYKELRRNAEEEVKYAKENADKAIPSIASSDAPLDETRNFYFSAEAALLRRKMENILHPILHGCANSTDTGWWATFKNAVTMANAIKIAKHGFAGIIGAYLPGVEKVLHHTGYYDADDEYTGKANTALQAILDAENDVARTFPNWKAATQCPHGLLKCAKLGSHSKALLTIMNAFFDNIHRYEEKKDHVFFSGRTEENRILIFLSGLTNRIYEENIIAAAANKNAEAIDDKELEPYIKVVKYLAAIPTTFHDIRAHWKKNSAEIDKLLSFLPPSEQTEIYNWMGALLERAEDPSYGYKDGDSSINLLIAGESGTGKTHIAKRVMALLGFPIICISLKELQEGQNFSINSLDELVHKDRLSGIEKKILCLQRGTLKGVSSLNVLFFIDELDDDRNYTISDLKDQLDQYKKWFLQSLGITLPGFMNCIFTTNNTNLIKDPALSGRFKQIIFPPSSLESKYNILLPKLQHLFEQKPALYAKYGSNLSNIVTKYVEFKPETNLRILMANTVDVVFHFNKRIQVKNGELFLVPPHQRNIKLPTFDDFLKPLLKNKKDSSPSTKKSTPKARNIPTCSSSNAYSSDDGIEEDSTSGDSD